MLRIKPIRHLIKCQRHTLRLWVYLFSLDFHRRRLRQRFKQIFHLAVQSLAQRNQRIYLRLVDVLLPLFVLLDGSQGDS